MSTEQERAEFEAACIKHAEEAGYDEEAVILTRNGDEYVYKLTRAAWWGYQAGRAALQSQVSDTGWKEAFKAWNVCASIHREWAKGKDAAFTTRQADFVRHAEDAFKKSMGEDALQSQDREDAFCVWHNDPETDSTWETWCGNLFILNDGTPAENRMKFCCYCGKKIREAIDHARRAEGGNHANS